MYKIMKTLVKGLCCHFIYRVKYIGLEKIDNSKKYIICPNHSNVLDPTFIFPLMDNLSIVNPFLIFLLIDTEQNIQNCSMNRLKDITSLMKVKKLSLKKSSWLNTKTLPFAA